MKTNNVFLILVLLIISSLAHKNKLQSAIESDSKFLSQIKSNKLGKIILGLSQLTTNGDYSSLFDALDLLIANLQSKLETQQDLFDGANSLHQSSVDTYESTIENLKLSIVDLEQSLNNNLKPDLVQIQDNIDTLVDRISNIQEQIEKSVSLREREQSEFKQRNQDLSEGIDAINEALDLLSSLLTENEEDMTVSLVQTQKQSLLQIKNKLQKKLKNVRNSFEYKPIIEALTQITVKDDFVDQATLRKIIDLLNEIQDSLEEMLYELQQQEEQAEQDYEETIANSNDDLELSQRILSENNEKLKDIKGNNYFISFFKK